MKVSSKFILSALFIATVIANVGTVVNAQKTKSLPKSVLKDGLSKPEQQKDKIILHDARMLGGKEPQFAESAAIQLSMREGTVIVLVQGSHKEMMQKIANGLKIARRENGYEEMNVEMVWGDELNPDPDMEDYDTTIKIITMGDVDIVIQHAQGSSDLAKEIAADVQKSFRVNYPYLYKPVEKKTVTGGKKVNRNTFLKNPL